MPDEQTENLRDYISLILESIRSSSRKKFRLNEFKSLRGFDDKMRYATERLKIMGSGSSRVACLLNSKSVLKIAKNEKGIAQNEAEVSVYTDPETKSIVSKIYDFDDNYEWIISEIVNNRFYDEFEFYKAIGMSEDHLNHPDIYYFFGLVFTYDTNARKRRMVDTTYSSEAKNFIKSLNRLVKKNDLAEGDVENMEHWGTTADGRVVLLDYGLNMDIYDTHYKFF